MNYLRRLEDTNFPCDKISNPDKEERISVEGFSKVKILQRVVGLRKRKTIGNFGVYQVSQATRARA